MRMRPRRVFLVPLSLLFAACSQPSGGTSRAPANDGSASGGSASGGSASGGSASETGGAAASGGATAGDGASAGGTAGTGGASSSTGGASGDSGVIPTTDGGNAPRFPAELLGGLGAWHLTLPTGTNSIKATEKDQPELETYADAYFGLSAAGDR